MSWGQEKRTRALFRFCWHHAHGTSRTLEFKIRSYHLQSNKEIQRLSQACNYICIFKGHFEILYQALNAINSVTSHLDKINSQEILQTYLISKKLFLCFLLQINNNLCDLNAYIRQNLVLQGCVAKLCLILLQNSLFLSLLKRSILELFLSLL